MGCVEGLEGQNRTHFWQKLACFLAKTGHVEQCIVPLGAGEDWEAKNGPIFGL